MSAYLVKTFLLKYSQYKKQEYSIHAHAPPHSNIVKYISDMLQNIVKDTCHP